MSYFWTTTEVAALRAAYPTGGIAAAQEAVPKRARTAIYGKANALGLRAPKLPSPTAGKRFARKYPQSEIVDAAIKAAYCEPVRGAIVRVAKEINRPPHWVHKRAVELGCSRTVRTRVDSWTKPELEILTSLAICTPKLIARELASRGFARTPTAVVMMLKRLSIDRTDPDIFVCTDVAKMLGVNPKTVTDWIDRRGLRATKTSRGPFGRFEIKRKHLREWVGSHPRYVDLRRVDQVWFMDLVFGAAETA